MKSHICLCAFVFLVACDRGEKLERQEGRDDIFQVDDEDAEMNAAMEQARKAFVEIAAEKLPEDFLLKAYFYEGEDEDGGEHMWVSEVRLDGGEVSGTLVSKPGNIPSLSEGDPVSFPIDRVSDWLYVKDGAAVGAYTVRLLRSRMSAEERAEHDSHYPFSF